jgi:multicomponent Na+:H+ antiporter subunit E
MKHSFYHPLMIKTLGLFLTWLLLTSSFEWPHVAVGLVAALGVAWLNTDRCGSRTSIHPLRLAWYFPWLIGRMLKSGLHLSALILHPALPIDPRMIRHRTNLREDSGIVLLGNSITLTPGTLTVEVDDQNLLVHAIDDKSAEDLRGLHFDRKIARLFGDREGMQ